MTQQAKPAAPRGSKVSRAPKLSVEVHQRITTFQESVEAAKIIARAVEDGVLDDAGEVAEITPEEFIMRGATLVGVVVTIRSSSPIPEGVFSAGRFVRETYSSERRTRPFQLVHGQAGRRARELIETKVTIPVKTAA